MTAPSVRSSRLASLADRHPVATFVALAWGISWALWLPTFVATGSASKLLALPGGFGPAIAAVALVRLRGDGVRAWLLECLDRRVDRRWYAVALGLPVLAGAAMGGLLVLAGGAFTPGRVLRMAPTYPVVLVFMTLVGGGQEELGWRGVALPALQERLDALTASAVVGAVWAVWHLPLFAFDVPGYGGRSFALYALLVVGFAVVFTWLYNGTGGSVLLAMVLHGGVNAASGLGGAFVAAPSSVGVPILAAYAVPIWLVAGALLLRHGRETLSAGPVCLAASEGVDDAGAGAVSSTTEMV